MFSRYDDVDEDDEDEDEDCRLLCLLLCGRMARVDIVGNLHDCFGGRHYREIFMKFGGAFVGRRGVTIVNSSTQCVDDWG